jgi:hypothetical protein
MPFWTVSITFEPDGEEIFPAVQAETGKQAVLQALADLEVPPNKLLHVIHIGPPRDYRRRPRPGERAASNV